MTQLPAISPADWAEQLAAVASESLSPAALAAMRSHYDELRRWNRSVALIGPGTVTEVIERHFGEALAALPLLPEKTGDLLDIGSGAGFPGLVLAAARPGWRVTLVEARQRKWSFLVNAARRAALSVRCLDARVAVPLPAEIPDEIDRVTMRAVRLPDSTTAALAERLRPDGRFLHWAGSEDPVPPPGFEIRGVHPLLGSRHRRIVEIARVR